jgi:hypothetical protein
MMKHTIVAILALVLTMSLTAQVFTVNETDPDDKKFDSIKCSDINSTLTIHLDKTQLLQKVSRSGASAVPEQTMNLLKMLTDALRLKNNMLETIQQAYQSYLASAEQPDTSRIAALSATLTEQAKALNPVFEADPVLDVYLAEAPSQSVFISAFHALERRVRELQLQLFNNLGPGYTLQLGAFLVHDGTATPVHLDGFDEYPRGEYYEVDRWQILPTPEQLEQFKALEKAAKENKSREANLSAILVDTYLKQVGETFKNALNASLQEFETRANAAIGNGLPANLVEQTKQIIAEVKTLVGTINERVSFYRQLRVDTGFMVSQLLENINGDIALLKSARTSLTDEINTLLAGLSALPAAVRAGFSNLVAAAKTSLLSLESGVLTDLGLDFLQTSRKLTNLALELSGKVTSFALDEGKFPDSTTLDLHYTGQRVEGDHIALKLLVKKDGNTEVMGETKYITLYRIAPNVRGTVGIQFAHPLSETAIRTDFQMAPYYNLLFNNIFGWSAKRKRYANIRNTLLDFNWGIHVSSPDFDKDDVPEIGVGIVLSGLKDYAQVGWAYNLFQATPYVFFGIRLPLAYLNIGNGNAGVAP